MGSCVLPGGNSHDRQRNARSLFGCIDFRSSPTQPASREDHQVEKCQTNPRDAEFFLQQTSAASCRGTNNSTYNVVADRVTIAFLGSPFPYPQISSVRFSCS